MTSHPPPFPPLMASGTSFNVGDFDSDGLLDVNEVWLYRATGIVAAGQYTNQSLCDCQ